AATLIAAGCVVSTIKASKYNDRPYLHDNLYLPSGKFIDEVSLGYKQVVADFVWFSAVQYFGDFRKGNHDLAYFKGLIDIVTSLDPHFLFGYTFGALVLCEDAGAFDEGIGFLKKGMSCNPTSWELPFEIGLLHYIDRHDYDIAARYFHLASKLPDCPPQAQRFAAFVYSKAGHEETSIRMWEEILNTSEEPLMRQLAERYLQRLKNQTRRADSHDRM
ncbi:MAG: hypothetical protein HY770_06365, partial [Chitinivibrionia bacterium]|nr:hypothetical protein [Chitinivibrionia bacterium]